MVGGFHIQRGLVSLDRGLRCLYSHIRLAEQHIVYSGGGARHKVQVALCIGAAVVTMRQIHVGLEHLGLCEGR
eukprot:23809-Eustigmatos_ZCMA.PRE.1